MKHPGELFDAKTAEPGQHELFEAQVTWFHVFHAMIEQGDLAEMGPHAFAIYAVIKSYTNFSTGRAFPGVETIAAKSGISIAQVKRELKTLEGLGYISKEKRGRSNVYTLREKIHVTDEHGRPQAVATWDYLPSSVQHAVADLKNVLITGDLAGAKIVHIERLHVQVNTGPGTAIQINEADLSKLPADLRAALEKIREGAARR